ncbi:MAG: GAF domain-containing sensor histidine kinase [Chloroflexi bacterium]|nr:GAF domain-containing sensor histidine kinase [Chloroflexota bacterium]
MPSVSCGPGFPSGHCRGAALPSGTRRCTIRGLSHFNLLTTTVAVVITLLLGIEQILLLSSLHSWGEYLVALGVAVLLGLILAGAVWRGAEGVRSCLGRQRQELVSPPPGGPNGEQPDLTAVLQEVVDQACELTGAHYGALEVPGEGAERGLFLTSGEPASVRRDEAEDRPESHSGGTRLMATLAEKYHVHLAGLPRDLRLGALSPLGSADACLNVPILSAGHAIGGLTVRGRVRALPFTVEDEVTLRCCAVRAAQAIVSTRRGRALKERAMVEERERLAREMHDSLAQVLGYISVKAQVARELVRGGQVDQAAQQLGQLVEVAQVACGDVREEILALRTEPCQGHDVPATLRSYLQQWQRRTSVRTELEVSPARPALPLAPDAKLQLLRIVQAALSNVRKHAAARQVRVGMNAGRDWIEVTIEDDGVGFDPTAPQTDAIPRFGLTMMRERAEIVGGELIVSSAPNRGTRVTVRLPLQDSAVRRQ